MAAAQIAAKVVSKSVPAAVAAAARRSVLQPGQSVVIPRWWSGQDVIDPARFVVDGNHRIGEADLKEDSLFATTIREMFHSVGLIHVQNTGLTDMKDQRSLARLVMGTETEYEGGANPRGRAADLGNVYDVGAPLEADLAYHHEVTYKSHSVESLGFLCKDAVTRPGVGWTFVSDSVQAHDYIMGTPLGQKLKDKGLCFVRRMTDAAGMNPTDSDSSAIYNHWQQSWMTDDPYEAEAAATAQGLQVEWIHDPILGRIMQTRYYKSAFEYIPLLDRNIMVTSIADDGEWFDSWPGISHVPTEQRPLEMFFGDDEPITLEEKQKWTDAYDRFGIPVRWRDGDVAVLCNMRFAHGRPGIELLPGEKRELGVMLGPLFERQETIPDKW